MAITLENHSLLPNKWRLFSGMGLSFQEAPQAGQVSIELKFMMIKGIGKEAAT